jgi:predicted RNA-binding Zn-ribbon protein involved in translation (DUF1610 family)
MSLSIACSSCGAKLRAPDNSIGRTFKCPKCGNVLTVGAMRVSRGEQSSSPLTKSVKIKHHADLVDSNVPERTSRPSTLSSVSVPTPQPPLASVATTYGEEAEPVRNPG